MGLAAPLRTGSRRTRTWHAIGAVRRPANLGGRGTSRGPNGSRDAAGGLRPPPGCQARGGRAEGAPPVGRSMPRRRLKIRPVPWHRLQIRPVVKVAASRLGCAAARAPWCCPWHWQRLAKAAASRLGCVCRLVCRCCPQACRRWHCAHVCLGSGWVGLRAQDWVCSGASSWWGTPAHKLGPMGLRRTSLYVPR